LLGKVWKISTPLAAGPHPPFCGGLFRRFYCAFARRMRERWDCRGDEAPYDAVEDLAKSINVSEAVKERRRE
jgi:hypothetical protein